MGISLVGLLFVLQWNPLSMCVEAGGGVWWGFGSDRVALLPSQENKWRLGGIDQTPYLSSLFSGKPPPPNPPTIHPNLLGARGTTAQSISAVTLPQRGWKTIGCVRFSGEMGESLCCDFCFWILTRRHCILTPPHLLDWLNSAEENIPPFSHQEQSVGCPGQVYILRLLR